MQSQSLILTALIALALVRAQETVHLVPLTWETVDYEVCQQKQ
jgi:hypothetical protein